MKYEVVEFDGPSLKYEIDADKINVSFVDNVTEYGTFTANMKVRVTEAGSIGTEFPTSVSLNRPSPPIGGYITFQAGSTNILQTNGVVGTGNDANGYLLGQDWDLLGHDVPSSPVIRSIVRGFNALGQRQLVITFIASKDLYDSTFRYRTRSARLDCIYPSIHLIGGASGGHNFQYDRSNPAYDTLTGTINENNINRVETGRIYQLAYSPTNIPLGYVHPY